MDLMVFSLHVAGLSSLVGSLNFIVTFMRYFLFSFFSFYSFSLSSFYSFNNYTGVFYSLFNSLTAKDYIYSSLFNSSNNNSNNSIVNNSLFMYSSNGNIMFNY